MLGTGENKGLRLGVGGDKVSYSPALAARLPAGPASGGRPTPPHSMACGLPELPWTFPPLGQTLYSPTGIFPKSKYLLSLEEKKKSPLLGSGSENRY